MAGMNFSNFREDGCEIVPAESVEVLPSNASFDLSNNSSYGNGQDLAGAAGPAAIASCINAGLDAISSISKCIALVSIEKQKTEQIKAAANAKVAKSKQQTEQVRIHEKAETERLIATCMSDLEMQKLELKKLQEKYKNEGHERKISHKEYLEELVSLERLVDDVIKDKDLTRDLLKSIIEEKGDISQIKDCLDSLDKSNKNLVEFSNRIVSLRGMK